MFHKRFIRYNFNMVEVMLAVIVVALGIASTFVLFPVGLNATRDTAAENRVAEISESVTMIIQSDILPQLLPSAGADGKNSTGFAFTGTSNFFWDKTSRVIDKAIDADSEIDPKTHKPIDSDKYERIGETSLYKYKSESEKGVYLFVQKDFAAAVKVYLDNSSSNKTGFDAEYFCDPEKGNVKYSAMASDERINKFLLPVVVEISWPVTLPADEREKRVYRFEMFNRDYDLKDDNDAQKS